MQLLIHSTLPIQEHSGVIPILTARTQSLGHEQSSKLNVGFDATLFGGLNISADYYYQHRYNIWYSTAGSYSSVFGLTAPYENVGVINQKGFEVSADYSKKFNNDFTINLGASMTLNKTIVEEQADTHSFLPTPLLQASDTVRHSVM